MPIGLRPRHDGGGDVAAGARAVLHHDRHADGRGEVVRQRPRHDVDQSAGRRDDFETNGFCSRPVRRAGLRPRSAEKAAEQQQRNKPPGDGASPLR